NEIQEALERTGFSYTRPNDLPDVAAGLLLDDRVVLWFQGGMEYGPRALGFRSILARPDSLAMRDRLNLFLKRRVWYQPFCPSILESDARRVFMDWKGSADRYMTMGYTVWPDCREAMAAVINVDGTCRPQIVPDSWNTGFADLLHAMKRRR